MSLVGCKKCHMKPKSQCECRIKIADDNYPKNDKGHYICTKEKPMNVDLREVGRWEHDDVKETDYDGEYYIEYKCHSCGHIWKSEMPD